MKKYLLFLTYLAFSSVLRGQSITLEIKTDQYPNEIRWEIRNSGGTILYSKPFGYYTSQFTVHTETYTLTSGTFTFQIWDQWSDGICCAYGVGYYKVIFSGTTLIEGGSYGAGETKTFTVVGAAPPEIPTGVAATPTSSSAISVSWTSVSGATSYVVDQALNSSFTSSLQTFTSSTNSYSASGLTASTTYYYRVRASNSAGNSGYSSVVQATTQSGVTVPGIPTGVTANPTSSSAISLSWTAVAGATNYLIDQATNSSFTGSTPFTSASNSYSASGLTASTTYYYRVRASNSAGNSGYSSVVQATTAASGGGGTSQWTTSGAGIYHLNPVHIGKSNTNTGAESGYSLYVANGIKAEKFKLEIGSAGGWADYVFDKNYKLMPLDRLKEYIEKNKHLPGFPSEKQIIQNNGYEMAHMIKLRQEAIENLHLYVIELEQKLSSLEQKYSNKKQ